MLVSAARRLAPARGSPTEAHAPLVIAHRGAAAGAPENSLAAFEAAIVEGADMVELDVRVTADSVLVVHHDSTVRGVPLSRLTFDQLRSRRAAVTTLADAVSLCRDRISVDAEVKVPGIERRVVDALRRSLDRDQVVVTSFHEAVVAAVKHADPAVVCGLLLGPARLRARTRRSEVGPLSPMHRSGADFILPHQLLASSPRPGAGRPGLLSRAAEAGVAVVVWTVNRPDRLLAYLADPRIAGVVTDVPELAAATKRAALAGRNHSAVPVTRPTDQAFPSRVRTEHSA